MDGFETTKSVAGTARARLASPVRGWLGLPPAAWSRLLVLFVALSSIKLALLFGLRKHLNEIHWRVMGQPPSWLNAAAFYAFVGLGVLSLLALGRRCQSAGVKAVRAANAAVVGLGLLFIFLTFHEGDKNYLYPVMVGILKWKSLGPYLSLNLFFRPPFLAGWLFGYALIYYALARTGREAKALYLTAAAAGAYGLVCLRELTAYRNELLVVDCFGAASLLVARRTGEPMRALWLLAPAAWVLWLWGLFRLVTPELGAMAPYFLLLVGTSLVLFAAATLLAKRTVFYRAWI